MAPRSEEEEGLGDVGEYRLQSNESNRCEIAAAGEQVQTDSSIGGAYASSGAVYAVNCSAGTYNTDGTAACQDCADDLYIRTPGGGA